MFASAQVNGEAKLAVIDARNGRLLAAWDDPGQLALDAARDRLIVDRGAGGVALLNATTGETQAVIELPLQHEPPAPQVNDQSGVIYAFRGTTIYVIDPAIRNVLRTVTLSINKTVCDAPAGDAPVYASAIDGKANRLYLTFVTGSCMPWVTATIVAYDATTLVEIGRTNTDIAYQAAAYNGNLYGTSVSRLGPTLTWAWDSRTRWSEQSADYQGNPNGIAVDPERELIYEAVGETLRVVDPHDRAVIGETTNSPLQHARLAGYDTAGEMLYLVSDTGRLLLWPVGNLFGERSPAIPAPSPLPAATVRAVVLSPNWREDRTIAALIENGDCPVAGGRLFLLTDPAIGWLSGTTSEDDPCEAVSVVAFSPAYAGDSLIFAAANRPPSILRSVDIGRSWKAADTAFPEGTTFISLIPSPDYAADQTLFSLTAAGLAYRSRDGGRNWQLLDQRLDHLALSKGKGAALELAGTRGSRFLHSTDSGETWREIGTIPGGDIPTLLAAAPSLEEQPIYYLFTAGGRFIRSLDGGLTWTTVLETSPAPVQLAIAGERPPDERPVFLLHDREIIPSYDGMASVWSAGVSAEAGRFQPTAIAIPPDFAAAPYLYVGTADGHIVRVRADPDP